MKTPLRVQRQIGFIYFKRTQVLGFQNADPKFDVLRCFLFQTILIFGSMPLNRCCAYAINHMASGGGGGGGGAM
jgi:hypothetical protein